MIFKPFLTSEDISFLQIQEAQSSQKQKRTPEQIEAIYSYGNNILVSASAGSGKTFVMVERIIDKILRGVTILPVTKFLQAPSAGSAQNDNPAPATRTYTYSSALKSDKESHKTVHG